MSNKYTFIKQGKLNYQGFVKDLFDFINDKQLLDASLWKKFVDVFRERPDSNDFRWRGEYWGKMMRGAAICYQYEQSEELYKVLRETTIDLLSTQDELGRISSYSVDKEFNGWDIWGRKYVLTALLHFYEICKEDELKERIIDACIKHVLYLVKKIGNKDGQKMITDTSTFWLGVNSSSILEPIVNLYKITNNKALLDFAKYIIDEGGIKEGNLIDEVLEGKHLPYQYPENKAYETMSFFEGVLEYALITNDETLKKAALKFFDDVQKTEMSIIGCAGSNEECFSNTMLTQLTKETKFMQETCVSVTYMRILAKLYMLTGESRYYDQFLNTGLNAFLGSVNYQNQAGFEYYLQKNIESLPFDSYSPLHLNRRGLSTGGVNFFKDGSAYGCCACIGSVSIGLIAMTSLLENKEEYILNTYYQGDYINGDEYIKIQSDYFKSGKVNLETKLNKKLVLRIPGWSNGPTAVIDGRVVKANNNVEIEKGHHKITLTFNPKLKRHYLDNHVAYTYGDLVLGFDNEDNPNICLEDLSDTKLSNFEIIDSNKDHLLVMRASFKDKEITLKNYASLGKHWNDPKSILTAWINK